MSLVELKLIDFINEVDSSSPAPGGGSVSALASSLGIALSRMVGHLTINRRKYLQLDEFIQSEYKYNFGILSIIKDKLNHLIDEDTLAYNRVMEAMKLPKENEEEIKIRKQAIEAATLEAIKVPFEVANLSYKALEVTGKMLHYGNIVAISDIGVGTLLMYSGLEGAILNVKINLSGISAEDLVTYKKECDYLLNIGKKLKDDILEYVHQSL